MIPLLFPLPSGPVRLAGIFVGIWLAAAVPAGFAQSVPPPSPSDLAELQGRFLALETEFALAKNKKDFPGAEQALGKLLEMAPRDPVMYFRRACLQALQGNRDQVWLDLDRAIEFGLRNPDVLRAERELALLQGDSKFGELLAKAEDFSRRPPLALAAPSLVETGIARVEAVNSAWDFRSGVFRTYFAFPQVGESGRSAEVASGKGEVEEWLRGWFGQGQAAGLEGDLYDNCDLGHSLLDASLFPQLARVRYGEEAMARGLGNGPQVRVIFNAVTLGNCSQAVTGGLEWRSLPRLVLTTNGGPALLYGQYAANHLYVYPEHRDHDADFHGDVFPANTPYCLISQGSSGSDQPFLRAVAATLAAFRPEVKRTLISRGALMPTVQMILRRCLRGQDGPRDYLSGAAHPTVFDAAELDVPAMVKLAHSLTEDLLPPVVRIRVIEESQPISGWESFSNESERLFDTPAAIARVHRTLAYSRRMVISAREGSFDIHGRPLLFRWSVLRGDPRRISIQLLNQEGSVAEVRIGYHERRPVAPGSPLFSDRVDIGVFASNGTFDSAPAFVSTYYPASERRIYDPERRLKSVDGSAPETVAAYVDPRIDGRRVWRDEFAYDAAGVRTGWIRIIGGVRQEFWGDGKWIVNPGEGKRVTYPLRIRGSGEGAFAEIVPGAAPE
jgi:hypothetical protein